MGTMGCDKWRNTCETHEAPSDHWLPFEERGDEPSIEPAVLLRIEGAQLGLKEQADLRIEDAITLSARDAIRSRRRRLGLGSGACGFGGLLLALWHLPSLGSCCAARAARRSACRATRHERAVVCELLGGE